MEFDLITRIGLGFVGLWLAVVLLHALVVAADEAVEPAAPVPPEEHHH